MRRLCGLGLCLAAAWLLYNTTFEILIHWYSGERPPPGYRNWSQYWNWRQMASFLSQGLVNTAELIAGWMMFWDRQGAAEDVEDGPRERPESRRSMRRFLGLALCLAAAWLLYKQVRFVYLWFYLRADWNAVSWPDALHNRLPVWASLSLQFWVNVAAFLLAWRTLWAVRRERLEREEPRGFVAHERALSPSRPAPGPRPRR